MSYPQPLSETSVVQGGDFFRLNTELLSDGDIYESAVGCHAIAIGPESDIATVNVAYWDPSAPGSMNQIIVDSRRPFTGRVDAHNETGAGYLPSNRPGRILFWQANLFNPLYQATGFAPGARQDVISPVLDIIQYFSPQPSLPSSRNDKTYLFQNFPWPAGGATYFLVVPFYGRKYASIEFQNLTTQILTVAIRGVIFAEVPAAAGNMETVISAAAAVGTGSRRSQVVLASANGMFDALTISFAPAAPLTGQSPLKIIMSDDEL